MDTTVPASSPSLRRDMSLRSLIARLDGTRIAASAGAITINAAVLMLLMAPMAAPQWLPPQIQTTEFRWIPRDPPRPVVPVPVPVVPRTAPQTASTVQRPITSPPQAPMVEAQAGDISTPPVDPVEARLPGVDPVVPMDDAGAGAAGPGMQLQYEVAPPPTYPRDAARAGLSGTVLLRVLVATDGQPMRVDVESSSGHRTLDRAAQRHVLERWRFRPALVDGRPVQAIGLVPVEFSLRR